MKTERCGRPARFRLGGPPSGKGPGGRCARAVLGALFLSALGHPAALLAADGRVGATSTASTTISLVIPHQIRITGLKDILLGRYEGAELTGSSPACVSRNGPGGYRVTVTSANGSFVLRSATQAIAIPYRVAWGANTISYNTETGAFAIDHSSLAACTPVTDRLRVTVAPAGMDVAPPGTYGDTLNVMVAPL